MDILFSNHTRDGSAERPGPQDHMVPSFICWGGPNGFDADTRTEIPGIGPHAIGLPAGKWALRNRNYIII